MFFTNIKVLSTLQSIDISKYKTVKTKSEYPPKLPKMY